MVPQTFLAFSLARTPHLYDNMLIQAKGGHRYSVKYLLLCFRYRGKINYIGHIVTFTEAAKNLIDNVSFTEAEQKLYGLHRYCYRGCSSHGSRSHGMLAIAEAAATGEAATGSSKQGRSGSHGNSRHRRSNHGRGSHMSICRSSNRE